MKYFKNIELSRLYNISEKSVRNWIEDARQGKTALELYEKDGKAFIADTVKNEILLQSFKDRSKKYRNSLSYKKLIPLPEFYELYNEDQIIDIAMSLDSYREIPQQYLYQGPAAISWSAYLHKLYASPKGNLLTDAIKLLKHNQAYILDLMGSRQLNIVDLGVGNGLAVKDFVQDVFFQKRLNKYIGIDVSPGLLSITKHNMQTWFEGQIPFQSHLKDFTHERFREIQQDSDVSNVLLFLGGTVKNFRHPLQALHTINDSMRPDDILVTSLKLDTKVSRRFFDLSPTPEPLPAHDRIVLDMLSIEPEMYEVEQYFDEKLMARHVAVKLKVDISISIETPHFSDTVTLERGESILLWRAWHWTAEEAIALHNAAGFKMIQASKSKDEQCLLLISKIDNVLPESL